MCAVPGAGLLASVRFSEPRVHLGGRVAAHTAAGRNRRGGNRANRGLRVVLDLRLALGRSAPRRDHEPGTSLHGGLERLVRVDALGVLVAEPDGAIQQIALDVVEHRGDPRPKAFHRHAGFLPRVAAGSQHLRLVDVLRPDLDAQRHTAHFPFRELPAGTLVALVQGHANARRDELRLNLFRLRKDRLPPVVAPDGHDHNLVRRDARRKHQPAVVAVHHDDGPDEARRDAPGGAPDMLHRLVARLERDIERPGKVLPQVVRRPRLQRAAVAHQRLDGIGAQRAGELFALALPSLDDRDRQLGRERLGVQVEDLQRFLFRFGFRFVRGVPFLPEELGGAQERARHLLPAHDIGPLVDEDRQIAPRLDPLGVHGADDGFRGRPDDELLLQLLAAAVRDVRDLRRKPLDVLRLALEEALGNEQRKVRVHVTGSLDPIVQGPLQQLPDGVAVGPDHHASFDRRVVGQLRPAHDIQVPAREILRARRDFRDERFLGFLHHRSSDPRTARGPADAGACPRDGSGWSRTQPEHSRLN